MHVLKPELLWIGKRCYRVNGVTIENSHEQQKHQQTKNEYIEDGYFLVFSLILFCFFI